jgi:hypothetical protein
MNGIQKQLETFLAAGDFSRYLVYLEKVKTDLDRSTGMIRDKKKNKEQLLAIQASQLQIAEKAIADEEKHHNDLKFVYDWGMKQLATDKNRSKANSMKIALESDLKNLNKARLVNADKLCEQILMLDPTQSEWAIKFKKTVARLLEVAQDAPKTLPIAPAPKPVDSNVTQPRKRKRIVEIEEED